MKNKRTLMSVIFALFLAAPLCAQSNWVDDFLRRYQPSRETPAASQISAQTFVGQVLQTGTMPVNLQDVIDLMLDYNLDIQSNRLSPVSSRLQSLVFYRALQPSLRFAANVSRDTSASTSQLIGAPSLSQLRHNFAVNFTQALPTGTAVGVDLTMNRQSSNSSNATFNPSYQGNLRYSIGQKLLRDRGRMPNMRQIHISENNQKISETQFEIQITNLLVQAQRSYWDLVFAGEDLKVKQRSFDLAERTLSENQMKVEIGTLAPIDVVQTRSEVATRREQLVTSTYAVVQTEDQIKKLISSDKDPSMFLLRLSALESPRAPTIVSVPALEDAVRTALENRPEMRQSAIDMETKELDVKYTANQKLPIFDVTASYNQNGTGGTRTERGNVIGGQILNVIPGGVVDAFGQLFSYNFSGYSLGFSFTLPLGNRAATADYDRAVNERRLSESRASAIAQQIALEVRNALTQVEMNRARIETAQIARELAGQRLEAEQTKFSLGTSTLRFVLEEQRNVAQAETNELQALVNFTKALVDLDRSTGTTLRRNNVEIEKALQQPSIAQRTGVAVHSN